MPKISLIIKLNVCGSIKVCHITHNINSNNYQYVANNNKIYIKMIIMPSHPTLH